MRHHVPMLILACLVACGGCPPADDPGGEGGEATMPGGRDPASGRGVTGERMPPGPDGRPGGRRRPPGDHKGADGALRVGVNSSGFSFECGRGSPEDYVEIYPSTIIDVAEQYYLADLDGLLTRFKTVAFDKYSMAFFMAAFDGEGGLSWARTVYDPGTGTGALGLAALSRDAGRVVGTDLDPLAVHNARFNARQLGLEDRFEVRQVPFDDQGAWSVVRRDERFDLVICDPPQGYDAQQQRPFPEIDEPLDRPREVFYTADVGYCFLESLVAGLDEHLEPGGRCWLAMKIPAGRSMLRDLATRYGFETRVLLDAAEARLGEGKRRLSDGPGAPDLSVNAQMIELTRSERRATP